MIPTEFFEKMSSLDTDDLTKVFEDSGYADLGLETSHFYGISGFGDFIYKASYEDPEDGEIAWATLYVREDTDGNIIGEF